MHSLNELQRTLITLGVVTAMVAVLGAVIWMSQDRVKQVQEQTRMKGDLVRNERNKLKQMTEMRLQIEEGRKQYERFLRMLPSTNERNRFLKAISKKVRLSEIEGIIGYEWRREPQPAGAEQAPYEEYRLKLPMKGSIFEFGKLLDFVEKYPRLIRVESFSLASGKKDEKGVIPLDIKLDLATFAYRPNG